MQCHVFLCNTVHYKLHFSTALIAATGVAWTTLGLTLSWANSFPKSSALMEDDLLPGADETQTTNRLNASPVKLSARSTSNSGSH